jgi:hypothetical protein
MKPLEQEIRDRLARLETKFDERWERVEELIGTQCPARERRLGELEKRMYVIWGASSAIFSAGISALFVWVRHWIGAPGQH